MILPYVNNILFIFYFVLSGVLIISIAFIDPLLSLSTATQTGSVVSITGTEQLFYLFYLCYFYDLLQFISVSLTTALQISRSG